MSLENEYYNEKQMLKNAEEKLAKFESLDVSKMTQEQIEAKERGIRRAKEDIKESKEIIEEIREELLEFIKDGGKISEITKKELHNECPEEFEKIEVKEKIEELGVYGIAYNIKKEELLNSDDPSQAMNEGLLDAHASSWEQSFENMDIKNLQNMTSKDVEKIIREEDEIY